MLFGLPGRLFVQLFDPDLLADQVEQHPGVQLVIPSL